MTAFLLGGAGLAVLHALLPNHWMPVVALGAREGWGRVALSRTAVLVAVAHVASSVALGILVGALGMGLGALSESLLEYLGGAVLIAMGVWVWWSEGSCDDDCAKPAEQPRPEGGLVVGLSLSMFLSPCLELATYYLEAARWGWSGIAALSLIYLFVTVPLIAGLVLAGDTLRARIGDRLHGLEHTWGRVTGGLLIALGVTSFFIEV